MITDLLVEILFNLITKPLYTIMIERHYVLGYALCANQMWDILPSMNVAALTVSFITF